MRRKIIGLYLILAVGNLGAWGWAFWAFHGDTVLLGTALLAYSFGLRHAVDADHIAAIDNVTRKLMQEGQRPIGVGFYFSLGHASVVAVASAAVALAATMLQTRLAAFRQVGGLIGTSVSVFFLFTVAAANLIVLTAVYRSFQRVKRGGKLVEEDFDALLAQRGFLARLFRPLFRLIRKSWHMFPLGFLFGLGFETATEIALLGIAAEAAKGQSFAATMAFPALFAAGMTLIDTTDSVLMLGAYGWAFVKPMRKLYYNLVITFVSVGVAVLVGGIEALGLVADQFGLQGPFWNAIDALNDNFGALGYAIIALFVLSWALSIAVYRWKRYDELDA
ncbi:MAG TPA: HoxN/HupN/NixA family nickel/cobalt transporter [Stellaceae bacterium]|nr:HoxN/HupN/NixA family nickel/cobalt transporter [Stellaceae bacterium]